jgi:hypothetical protein
MSDNYRMLCVDPGENTGWSIWKDDKVLGGGQTPLWNFAMDVYNLFESGVGPLEQGEDTILRPGIDPEENTGPIGLIVVEAFKLYPWEARKGTLDWNEFRTTQLIGAITFFAQLFDVRLHKQDAKIKERALAGGAEELFLKPAHENRHQNDSIMHGFFYRQVEVHGRNIMLPKKGK